MQRSQRTPSHRGINRGGLRDMWSTRSPGPRLTRNAVTGHRHHHWKRYQNWAKEQGAESPRLYQEAQRPRSGAQENLTLYPTWRIARLSPTSLHLSASAPAAPARGPACGPTCLGRRSQSVVTPLEGADASGQAFWNISPSPDNSMTNCDSFQHFFLLLVLAAERAYRPKAGRITALA